MAGKPKRSIDFAGWRADIFENDTKIDELIDGQGWIGFSIYFYLCQKAYASDGYFYRWSYANAATTARRMGGGIRSETIKQVVALCLRIGLFDKRLFDRESVLTSRGIQRRYMVAIEKRSFKEVKEKLWLLNEDESKGVVVVPENNNSIPENADSLPENATNKSKENKSNYYYNKQTSEAGCTYSEEIKTIFELYKDICISFPDLTNKEQYISKLEALMNQYKLDEFELVFKKLETNSFFKGNNNQNWKAAFGWTIKPENFKKILYGFYDNRNKDSSTSDDSIEKYKVVINQFDLPGGKNESKN